MSYSEACLLRMFSISALYASKPSKMPSAIFFWPSTLPMIFSSEALVRKPISTKALGMVVILTLIQLGVAAFRREGRGRARALGGAGQFVVVCATWFGYCAVIVAACGALTRALMLSGALLMPSDAWVGVLGRPGR